MNESQEIIRNPSGGLVIDYAAAINAGRRAQAHGVREAFQALGRILRRGGDRPRLRPLARSMTLVHGGCPSGA